MILVVFKHDSSIYDFQSMKWWIARKALWDATEATNAFRRPDSVPERRTVPTAGTKTRLTVPNVTRAPTSRVPRENVFPWTGSATLFRTAVTNQTRTTPCAVRFCQRFYSEFLVCRHSCKHSPHSFVYRPKCLVVFDSGLIYWCNSDSS